MTANVRTGYAPREIERWEVTAPAIKNVTVEDSKHSYLQRYHRANQDTMYNETMILDIINR